MNSPASSWEICAAAAAHQAVRADGVKTIPKLVGLAFLERWPWSTSSRQQFERLPAVAATDVLQPLSKISLSTSSPARCASTRSSTCE